MAANVRKLGPVCSERPVCKPRETFKNNNGKTPRSSLLGGVVGRNNQIPVAAMASSATPSRRPCLPYSATFICTVSMSTSPTPRFPSCASPTTSCCSLPSTSRPSVRSLMLPRVFTDWVSTSTRYDPGCRKQSRDILSSERNFPDRDIPERQAKLAPTAKWVLSHLIYAANRHNMLIRRRFLEVPEV